MSLGSPLYLEKLHIIRFLPNIVVLDTHGKHLGRNW